MQPHDLQPGKKKKRNRWLGWLVPTPEQKKESMYSVVALVHPYYILTYLPTVPREPYSPLRFVACDFIISLSRARAYCSIINNHRLTTTYLGM